MTISIGARNYIGEVNTTDTAELVAYLTINEQPVTADQILTVSFIVQDPTATTTTVIGEIQPDGSGFYRWTDTTVEGQYLVQAQFTLMSGEIRSIMTNFTVVDPFNPPAPTSTDLIVEQVELRIGDLFDSLEGGPWLRDMTLAAFDSFKIADFIPEALININVQMPPTQFDIDYFTLPVGTDPNPNMPILIKGVLALVCRHLARSYTEQPMPQGGQIVWEDRTRYHDAWLAQYQVENQDFIDMTRLWKRTLFRFGHSALLTFNKAGRLFPYQNMRSRGIYRGFY